MKSLYMYSMYKSAKNVFNPSWFIARQFTASLYNETMGLIYQAGWKWIYASNDSHEFLFTAEKLVLMKTP